MYSPGTYITVVSSCPGMRPRYPTFRVGSTYSDGTTQRMTLHLARSATTFAVTWNGGAWETGHASEFRFRDATEKEVAHYRRVEKAREACEAGGRNDA